MNLLKRAIAAGHDFSTVGTSTHASSISYYTFLSLVPLLSLCISLISLVGISAQEVCQLIAMFVPDALDEFVGDLVADAYARSDLAFSLSTISLLWSSSKGVKALRAGLNAAYDERETRGVIAVALISIASVVMLGILLTAAMWLVFSNSLLHTLSQHMPELQPHHGILDLAETLATLVMGVIILTLCYTFLPAGHRRFKAQLPGAACALVGCGILSFGFRIYVDQFANYTLLYGSIATVALLLLWMYLVFYILVVGGFLNRYLQKSRETRLDSRE